MFFSLFFFFALSLWLCLVPASRKNVSAPVMYSAVYFSDSFLWVTAKCPPLFHCHWPHLWTFLHVRQLYIYPLPSKYIILSFYHRTSVAFICFPHVLVFTGLFNPKRKSGMSENETRFEISFMTHGIITKINIRGGDLFQKFVFFPFCVSLRQCDFRQPHVTGAVQGKEWQ